MKDFSKVWQCWQRLREHIDEILIIVVLLLVALAVVVMFSEDLANYLQQLLGLRSGRRGKYDMLKTLGFCVAGVVSIWLAWAANKRAKAMENAANEQAKATKNTEAGQRQERLKNAIEHLGHKRDSVRMGGAYELFHLAKDTRDLRQTILDILCAHIRQTTSEDKYKEKHKAEPSEEIQGLLTLLFVQEHDVFEDCSINLQGSYLNGTILVQARLKGANLREAQLQGALLWWAQMQNANLWRAQLLGATLWGAQLLGANLWQAQLQGATLWQAELQGATLRGAQMQGVSSHEAYLLPSAGFENRIRSRIGEPSDLTGIIFAGGLQQEDLDTLCRGLSTKKAQALRERLRSHVKPEISHRLPENSGAETGAYTQEEAEQWIVEYNEAMQKVPRSDDTANADSAPDSGKGKGD